MKYNREDALDRVRQFLVSQMREGETTCEMAARLGTYCHGLDRFTTEELCEQYPWLAKKLPPNAPRADLARLIVAWNGARSVVHDVCVTCDAMSRDRDACTGFAQFSGEDLKGMFPQLFSAEDEIAA